MAKLAGTALISWAADTPGMRNIATRMYAGILRGYAVDKEFRLSLRLTAGPRPPGMSEASGGRQENTMVAGDLLYVHNCTV
jgi:hypothetical protein